MAYKRVTKEERRLIYRWRQEGLGLREAARRLGRAASSTCRELVRNRGQRGYRPKQVHWKATEKARRTGSRLVFVFAGAVGVRWHRIVNLSAPEPACFTAPRSRRLSPACRLPLRS